MMMDSKVLEYKLTSVNICSEVEHLYNQPIRGHWCIPIVVCKESYHNDCKI